MVDYSDRGEGMTGGWPSCTYKTAYVVRTDPDDELFFNNKG